jgi:hypothetical protein
MLRIARLLALAGLAVTTGALAAPRAQSALECGIAADMAVVAKSLAAEKIDRAKADTIMARIYDVSSSERGKALMKEITDAAYSAGTAAAGGTAQNFAESLYSTCLKSGGDMDPVLGKKL